MPKLNTTWAKTVGVIVAVALLLGVVRYSIPEVRWSLGNLTTGTNITPGPLSGLPFYGFFTPTGLLMLALVIGIFVLAAYLIIKGTTGKQR